MDLGCGTAAVAWAFGLLIAGLQQTGVGNVPHVEIHAIDSSPFMIEHARLLWNQFQACYAAETAPLLDVQFRRQNWVKASIQNRVRPWIVGAYLFDHLDRQRASEIAESLCEVARTHEASSLFLLANKGKADLLSNAIKDFPAADWVPVDWKNILGDLEKAQTR